MQLTLYTDYSLRVLVYLGLKGEDLATISEIAEHFGISRNHLVKVVHNLATHNFIHTVRGKGGGMRLARSPDLVNIGDVVRHTEPNFNIVECFEKDNQGCAIKPICKLKGALHRASRSFMNVLDEYTLADVLQNREDLNKIIFMENIGTGNS
ncbi:MAG TPA: Rrf2 family transcriptional regulator [Gammaproteobacteria bacterium]|nr:Rrf2 family transcriptional regulator [Gammaproteobacteria bacterium]